MDSDSLSISSFEYDSESSCSFYSFNPTETYVDAENEEELVEAGVKTALQALPEYGYEYECDGHLPSGGAEDCPEMMDVVEEANGAETNLKTALSQGEGDVTTAALASLRSSELTTAYEHSAYVYAPQSEEEDLNTAYSYIEADTALSEISIYSQYTPPPSETNVEIEYDIIADASPISTAVDGNVSWYTLPNSDVELGAQGPVYIGGARVVDSLECLHKLPSAQLIPVENFEGLNMQLIYPGIPRTASEIEEDEFEYSYYSEGPSETNVSMEGYEDIDEQKGTGCKADGDLPENELNGTGVFEL
ncbi:hypothetical protein Q1695_003147 [Nippostrongylus brasiliensis]|nr:hypothetical protein Q1695_003147 [Nippostrongylus brasiliensis]